MEKGCFGVFGVNGGGDRGFGGGVFALYIIGVSSFGAMLKSRDFGVLGGYPKYVKKGSFLGVLGYVRRGGKKGRFLGP